MTAQCWKYLVFTTDLVGLQSVDDTLNDFGAEGWELVSVRNHVSYRTAFYLKRPVERPSPSIGVL